ncbi:hypothetical protein EIP91_003595 [Steccherinum ochraceum]|uniref:Protein kinase domain-containing protein n=1 Tax=Steccherinum ochraceum TaxID=92696 RepID=A0A4R0RQX9_9APHY|nr:hypothetical protein EIP91_003595 [Steccherinum ochraceum]
MAFFRSYDEQVYYYLVAVDPVSSLSLTTTNPLSSSHSQHPNVAQHSASAHYSFYSEPQSFDYADGYPATSQQLDDVETQVAQEDPILTCSVCGALTDTRASLHLLSTPTITVPPLCFGNKCANDWSKFVDRLLRLIIIANNKDKRLDAILQEMGNTVERAEKHVNMLNAAMSCRQYEHARRNIHQMLLQFARMHNVFPKALFVPRVSRSRRDSDPYCMGAFGDVYVAKLNGLKVALKRPRGVLNALPSKEAELLNAFRLEAMIAMHLDHEHILPFLGVDDKSFARGMAMVSPWMENSDIRKTIDRLTTRGTPFQELQKQINLWIHETAVGLRYLHSVGVVHGDLRGPNILIDDDGVVKLTDFGLSVFHEAVSGSFGSTRGGNTFWQAPEILTALCTNNASTRPTFPSDVYSFGCTISELLTSARPFAGMSESQVLTLVPKGLRLPIPDLTPRIPNVLSILIHQTTEIFPANRPAIDTVVNYTRHHSLPKARSPVFRRLSEPSGSSRHESSRDREGGRRRQPYRRSATCPALDCGEPLLCHAYGLKHMMRPHSMHGRIPQYPSEEPRL